MKIISIIGTRPQYIKVKPIHDFCKKNSIPHILVDTNQHFSDTVSKNIIQDLKLNIDVNLKVDGSTEMNFISDGILKLEKFFSSFNTKEIFVLVYGDTNTSLITSLVCYKKNIKFAHIESGVKSGNLNIPEEVNRIFCDMTSDINFVTRKIDLQNVNNGIYSGDLEYELLNSMDIKFGSEDFGLMTIHRQSNTTSKEIQKIFDFCKNFKHVILPIHHRIENQKWFKEIKIPKNLEITKPFNYSEMVKKMANCKFLITDSGGVLKTSPFFGKKTLIIRGDYGWTEPIDLGFAKVCNYGDEDVNWVYEKPPTRVKNLYLSNKNSSEIIIKEIYKIN